MNPWWLILGLLGALWTLPMFGGWKAGMPWWFFICVACLWFAVFFAAGPLYD